MIKINLLPLEKRKPERTPLPRLFLIIVEAALVSILVFYIIFIYLKISDKDKEIQTLQTNFSQLSLLANEYDKKVSEKSKIEQMVKEIDDVTFRQLKWSEVIDALWDIIYNNPRIWLEEIKILDARGAQTELKKFMPGATFSPRCAIQLKCCAAGENTTAITNFRMDLKKHPKLCRIFDQVNPTPDFKVSLEEDSEEKFFISFTVILFNIGGQTTKESASLSPLPK